MNEGRAAREEVDSRYYTLFRIGGVAFILTGVAYLACLVLTYLIPPSSGSAASYLQATSGKVGLISALWVVYMVSDLLLVPALLALYFVLKEKGGALLLIGTSLVAGYLVFDLGITEPNWLALASLAHGYGGATGAAQQTYVGAAQYGLALVPYLNFLSFAISGTGFLAISIVMLRSSFRRRTAILGMAVMLLAIVAAFSWFVPLLGYAVTATLGGFSLWCVLIGAQLYRVGSRLARLSGDEKRPRLHVVKPHASIGS